MNQRNWKANIILILLVLNLAATACMGGYLVAASRKTAGEKAGGALRASMETGGKYTLYIGTNDKDSYTQLISTEEAREKVNAICKRYVGGYTASEAVGCWIDETDTMTQEQTLVYTLNGVTEEQVQAVVEDVLRALNQNTVLVEYEVIKSVYYGRSGEQPGE